MLQLKTRVWPPAESVHADHIRAECDVSAPSSAGSPQLHLDVSSGGFLFCFF